MLEDFIPAVCAAIPRFRKHAPNAEQEVCILHPREIPLQIVAGPGSGKTTVLVLRALRHVLVDGLLPEEVLLTTFTKKAAAEIRTRLIEWGQQLIAYLRPNATVEFAAFLNRLDINRFFSGTLDSICEEVIRDMRSPTSPTPALLEGFAANTIMYRKGLVGTVYAEGEIDPKVNAVLATFNFGQEPIRNSGDLVKVVRPLFDRFSHDLVDLDAFRVSGPDPAAHDVLARAYEQYCQELESSNRLDFARLEALFLKRLRGNDLGRLTERVKAILVDEYQDTNLLQESIYFELYKRASGSTLTVVGDDDQSLYRFRGATVELFRDFAIRLEYFWPEQKPVRRDLVSNYRSTPEIVQFFNEFIINDPDFAPARVSPPKPRIRAVLPSVGFPVFGMFRDSADKLAHDLARLLVDVFRGDGRVLVKGRPALRGHIEGGDFGDAVFLAHSVNEFGSSFFGKEPKPRLPHLLRNELFNQAQVKVFNPRGQALKDVRDVRRLVGAMLECVDPGGKRQASIRLRGPVVRALNELRTAYHEYAATDPYPRAPQGLSGFVGAWGRRVSQTAQSWPSEWPLLELCFKLLSWFPELRDDPEGQIYLEAVARAIGQAATFSPYKAKILEGSGEHDGRSVDSSIRDIFGPLGEGLIDVDEEIMPHIPRDRLALMTIHQAKGLEYPLVIVDVGSDYTKNHPKQAFRRFPKDPSNVAEMEDHLAAACPIGPLRRRRSGLQRTFEDLIRLYYVAFSRPQTALLLIGLDPMLRWSNKAVKNIATFWRRDETWPWCNEVSAKKKPGMADNVPLVLI
ncbi:MAG: UvrD-helicase domain-containing protein [Deltaproteobacteria bacterium]|nr:UvrD-helicase domain-containing protein [Deltaproteobacteria bacterium]